jgi:Spy/CpxP family protein refolding chaperone
VTRFFPRLKEETMSNGRWRTVLVISLVFNAAVAGALIVGLARQARLERELGRVGEGGRGVSRGRHLLRGMELSDEKRERIERFFEQSQAETSVLRDRLETARGELYALLRADRPDQGAIDAKIDEIASIQGELEKVVVHRLLRVSETLDPAERERFLNALQRRMHSELRRHGRETGRRTQRGGGMK